jgi:dipeptidase E
MERRLLLISNSTAHGSGFLEYCAPQIQEFLGEVGEVLFVPYALADRDGYAATAGEAFRKMGYACTPVHRAADPRQAVAEAEALFVGGGNTFRLLENLYRHQLLEPIRRRVAEGMPYVGSSAGSNVACLTIKTTNDMPIVEPPSFDALALVPFNLNPHYLDPDPSSTHMGETREQRLKEFHEENHPPVLALREGSMLRVESDAASLLGETGGRLFRRGQPAEELAPGAQLDFLLAD